jgi:cytidine deaminase
MEPRGVWSAAREASNDSFKNSYVERNGIWIPRVEFMMPWFALEDLPHDTQRLILQASHERKNAHAPRSNFLVGAAADTAGGNTLCGHNTENMILKVTHAVENALDQMQWQDFAHITAAAFIAGPDEAHVAEKQTSGPVLPCGNCRQLLWEFCDGNLHLQVFAAEPDLKKIWATSLGALLPQPFSLNAPLGTKEYAIRRAAQLSMQKPR